MSEWTREELEKVAGAEELELASIDDDGRLRKPVTIWVVRSGDDFYVRSWRGPGSAWFRGVQSRHEGHVSAGGVEKDVRFVEADETVNDEIDAAYRSKYRRYGDAYVEPMIAPQARNTTLRLVPADQ